MDKSVDEKNMFVLCQPSTRPPPSILKVILALPSPTRPHTLSTRPVTISGMTLVIMKGSQAVLNLLKVSVPESTSRKLREMSMTGAKRPTIPPIAWGLSWVTIPTMDVGVPILKGVSMLGTTWWIQDRARG